MISSRNKDGLRMDVTLGTRTGTQYICDKGTEKHPSTLCGRVMDVYCENLSFCLSTFTVMIRKKMVA